jgi:hypothetical protein
MRERTIEKGPGGFRGCLGGGSARNRFDSEEGGDGRGIEFGGFGLRWFVIYQMTLV